MGSGAYDRLVPKLLLLDGHSLAYRAFYALPADLATPSGTFTNAVFGFTSMLAKVLTDEKPDYIAVAFDTRGPTFRDAMDPEYKAGRKATPDVFSSQMPLIREVLDALKIPVLEIEGVEADDVIATLAVGGPLRDRLVAAGLAHAARFSPALFARTVRDELEKVAGMGRLQS